VTRDASPWSRAQAAHWVTQERKEKTDDRCERSSRFRPFAVQHFFFPAPLCLSLLYGSARIILAPHLQPAGRWSRSAVTRSWFETPVGHSGIRCARGKGPRELAGEDGQTGTT
jgi:hypothetical protein